MEMATHTARTHEHAADTDFGECDPLDLYPAMIAYIETNDHDEPAHHNSGTAQESSIETTAIFIQTPCLLNVRPCPLGSDGMPLATGSRHGPELEHIGNPPVLESSGVTQPTSSRNNGHSQIAATAPIVRDFAYLATNDTHVRTTDNIPQHPSDIESERTALNFSSYWQDRFGWDAVVGMPFPDYQYHQHRAALALRAERRYYKLKQLAIVVRVSEEPAAAQRRPFVCQEHEVNPLTGAPRCLCQPPRAPSRDMVLFPRFQRIPEADSESDTESDSGPSSDPILPSQTDVNADVDDHPDSGLRPSTCKGKGKARCAAYMEQPQRPGRQLHDLHEIMAEHKESKGVLAQWNRAQTANKIRLALLAHPPHDAPALPERSTLRQ